MKFMMKMRPKNANETYVQKKLFKCQVVSPWENILESYNLFYGPSQFKWTLAYVQLCVLHI